MERLSGTVAVITGAGSGIGRAVAERFVAEGARVVAFDLSQERLQSLKHETGADLITVTGNVTSWEDNHATVSAALAQWNRLDCFIGNAGIHDGNRRLQDLSVAELERGIDEIFGINVRGYLLGARAAIPELQKTRGNMIFTLSTSSFYTGGGGPLYLASKHATLGLMRALACELAPDVRVNGVAPSGTPTNLRTAAALMAGSTARAPAAPTGAAAPANLLGLRLEPEDHAGAYVFLASSEARAITGVTIHTDAGRGVSAARVTRSP